MFQGDGGDDLLVTQASGTLDGGGGDDELVGDPGGRAALTLLGQNGDDVLLPSRGAADGGRDEDIIVGHNGRLTVSAGSDWIDVAGGDASSGPDTVSCGSGFDVIWMDADDQVSRDCEIRLRGPAPTVPQATNARAHADALLAHVADPAS